MIQVASGELKERIRTPSGNANAIGRNRLYSKNNLG